uniref:Uncharacterized protein n=1 Tax=Talaromyces marneffei PM1 TaxID=1077442 RepID=A0A093XB33_TALMA
MAFLALTFLALGLTSFAQRPESVSICDFYTPRILGANTAPNQELLMTLLVNTFVIGNYTTPNTGVAVHGIAAPAEYNGHSVALLPYFTGEFNSTNTGGNTGASKLFLDDGGAVPLTMNMSSNGNTSSAQYKLLTHIYHYFGTLLGCSLQGDSSFPHYEGRTSMYEVHRSVEDSATSLGISSDDAKVLGNTLNTSFNTRCAPATAITNISAPAELQSVCIADNCPADPKQNCAAYPLNGVALLPVNLTATSNSTGSTTPSSTSTSTPSSTPSKTSDGNMVVGGYWQWVTTVVLAAFTVLY